MKHITLTPFGQRPVTAAQIHAMQADVQPGAPVDKWALLARLRVARANWGITDRDLSVLAALLSFLPARMLQDGGSMVVFPSNASLSDRAHGMAESTLRRHLGALVAAGLIWRHDSPNGKRFARRAAVGRLAVAFGLDLTPLARAAEQIARQADAAEETAQALHRRREALVLRLRDTAKLLALASAGREFEALEVEAALAPIRRTLRRQMTAESLAAAEAALAGLHASAHEKASCADARNNRAQAEETDANAVHFKRHQQDSNPNYGESESCQETGNEAADPPQPNGLPPLAMVLKACPDILPYTARSYVDWHEFTRAASVVRPQMGISSDAWKDAVEVMGSAQAALVVAGILQRFSAIRSAGGYLRALTARARQGQFSPRPMIMSLLSARAGES